MFDPACGSGNFLVIGYKQMRAIEAEINRRRGERERKSNIPISNFRGIEIANFPAEIARLALVIAEYQCNVNYLGQRAAVAEVLPLDKDNWITCANALRVDWRRICPPSGTGVKLVSDDLFRTPLDQFEIRLQERRRRDVHLREPALFGQHIAVQGAEGSDLKHVFMGRVKHWKSLDYVAGWFIKAADYIQTTPAAIGIRHDEFAQSGTAGSDPLADDLRCRAGDRLRPHQLQVGKLGQATTRA